MWDLFKYTTQSSGTSICDSHYKYKTKTARKYKKKLKIRKQNGKNI